MNFETKVVFVTGASRGIGAAIAKEFVKKGYVVIGTSTSETGADNIRRTLEKYGIIYGIKLDVTKVNDIKSIFSWMKNNTGLADIIINNAGITKDNLMVRLTEDDWFKVINTNLSSIFSISKMGVRHMMKQRWGRIISIGSIVGTSGNLGQTNYCASKAGLIGFSKSLAQELASRNITVNVIAPGFIQTDMTSKLTESQRKAILSNIPAQTLGIPEDIAKTAMFLASDSARYITGQTIHVNGGMYMP